jgi:hypothetical protein
MTKDTIVLLVESFGLVLAFVVSKYLGDFAADIVKGAFLLFQPYFIKWLAKWLGVELLRAARGLK